MTGSAFDGNASVVSFYDLFGNGKAKTGAGFFGGEKRLEDAAKLFF